MDIGSAIKHCRKKRQISQKELAELADVSVSHLCLIEKSKREASLSTLESLSNALSVPLSVLVLIASDSEINEGNEIDLDKITKLVNKLMQSTH